MNLLIKYYDKDSIGGGIPDEVKRNCSNCKTETNQVTDLYNPDNPEEGEVWVCTVCKERTDWVTT